MVKWGVMNAPNEKPAAAIPNFIKSMLAGFDHISKHAWLVIFPIAIDLWIWLGPRLPMKSLIQSVAQQLLDISRLGVTPESDLAVANHQMWEMMAERFNVMIALRSYPVGIPSLMAGRMPLETPLGTPLNWEIGNVLVGVALWLALSLIGLVVSTLFYQVLGSVALGEPLNLRAILSAWPKNTLRVLGVAAALVMIYILVSLPASCLLVVASISGMGQCIFFMYTGFLVWLLFPFFLSGHGIFINGDGVAASIFRGARITRLLIIPTSLMFLMILFLTQTLDLLWNATPDASWLTLLGVIGHAFVTTGMLAGTFVYYKEADQWIAARASIPAQPIR
jgi:hypothetical protein